MICSLKVYSFSLWLVFPSNLFMESFVEQNSLIWMKSSLLMFFLLWNMLSVSGGLIYICYLIFFLSVLYNTHCFCKQCEHFLFQQSWSSNVFCEQVALSLACEDIFTHSLTIVKWLLSFCVLKIQWLPHRAVKCNIKICPLKLDGMLNQGGFWFHFLH